MKIDFTDAADADLETIGDYIALSNPFRAASFVHEIREKCFGLRENSLAFPLLGSHEASGIRRRVHGSYLIFYRIGPEAVEILRVLHGAREYEQILFPEEG
ncbi:MAG: plasmid stabilization protein [Kaistia sp. SCN 65-12]|nr:MAG: plasmid stabilization protein [Kaistia sp. SCN 65-12]